VAKLLPAIEESLCLELAFSHLKIEALRYIKSLGLCLEQIFESQKANLKNFNSN